MIFKDEITRKLEFSEDDEKMQEYLKDMLECMHQRVPVNWNAKLYQITLIDVAYLGYVDVKIQMKLVDTIS